MHLDFFMGYVAAFCKIEWQITCEDKWMSE